MELIGIGSCGRVFKLRSEQNGEVCYCAMKHISIPQSEEDLRQLRYDGLSDTEISLYYSSIAQSITDESRLMRELRGHPNIVAYEDSRTIAKSDGIGCDLFIRMELLTELTRYASLHRLERDEVIKLGRQMCSALMLCADYSIIHRDIKPANIFVTEEGDFKLGDFGIARNFSDADSIMSKKGTFQYMAPEVYGGKKYGASVDVYSVGLIMYQLLNRNRLPFLPLPPNTVTPRGRDDALIMRIKGEPLPLPADAKDELGNIILTACKAEPKRRYGTAKEMLDALNALSLPKAEAEAAAVPPSVPDFKAEPAEPCLDSDEYDPLSKTITLFEPSRPVIPSASAGQTEPRLSVKIGSGRARKRYCNNCGTMLEAGNPYCPVCNERYVEVVPEKAEEPVAVKPADNEAHTLPPPPKPKLDTPFLVFACIAAVSALLLSAKLFDSFSVGLLCSLLASAALMVAAFMSDKVKRFIVPLVCLLFAMPNIVFEIAELLDYGYYLEADEIIRFLLLCLPHLAFIVLGAGSLFRNRLVAAVGASLGLLCILPLLMGGGYGMMVSILSCLIAISIVICALRFTPAPPRSRSSSAPALKGSGTVFKRRCRNCKTVLERDSLFCHVCGERYVEGPPDRGIKGFDSPAKRSRFLSKSGLDILFLLFACLAVAADLVLYYSAAEEGVDSPAFIIGCASILIVGVVLMVAAFMNDKLKRRRVLLASLLFSVPFVALSIEGVIDSDEYYLLSSVLLGIAFSSPSFVFVIIGIGALRKNRIMTAVGMTVGLYFTAFALYINRYHISKVILIALFFIALALSICALRCCRDARPAEMTLKRR